MFRKTMAGALGLGAAGLIAVAASAGPALAAGGGACTLNGTASFGKPLSITSQTTNYSFTGSLTNCQSSNSAPASGTITAGEVLTIGGYKYQEPLGTLTGGCTNSTTSGTSIVQWAGGGTTVIGYSTTGAAAAVELNGTVQKSITLQPVPGQTQPDGTAPPAATVNTTVFGGDVAGGVLAFEPPDPTACNGAGVASAGIQGEVGIGEFSPAPNPSAAAAKHAVRSHHTRHAARRA